MESTGLTFALTASEVLRYAAAFFFVVVAIAIAIALAKLASTLGRVDKVLADVDQEIVPLMRKAGVTLDGVNANLTNVDDITKDVADITDKIDTMANAVEGMVSGPARKAAAFGAGVQTAVGSFMRRGKRGSADEAWEAADEPEAEQDWTSLSREPVAEDLPPEPATHEPATRDPLTEPAGDSRPAARRASDLGDDPDTTTTREV